MCSRIEKHHPKVVQFFAPWIVSPEDRMFNMKLLDDYRATFVAQVGSVQEADDAFRHGVNVIIFQGSKVLSNYQDAHRDLKEEDYNYAGHIMSTT